MLPPAKSGAKSLSTATLDCVLTYNSNRFVNDATVADFSTTVAAVFLYCRYPSFLRIADDSGISAR